MRRRFLKGFVAASLMLGIGGWVWSESPNPVVRHSPCWQWSLHSNLQIQEGLARTND